MLMNNFALGDISFSVAMAGGPELGDTRGAQHEGVPEHSRGVHEPSHGAHDGGDGSLSQPRHVGRLIKFQFQFALILSHTMLVD